MYMVSVTDHDYADLSAELSVLEPIAARETGLQEAGIVVTNVSDYCIEEPHVAYVPESARYKPRRVAAENVRAVLLGQTPPNAIPSRH